MVLKNNLGDREHNKFVERADGQVAVAVDIGGAGSTANQIQGNIAAGAADAGNPVKTGGVNSTTQPTLTDGLRGDTQLDTRGNTKVTLVAPNSSNVTSYRTDNADSVGSSSVANNIGVSSRNTIYNGTNWDRVRTASGAAATTGAGLQGAGVLGIYNASAPTVTDANFERLQIDVNANLKTREQYAPTAEDNVNNLYATTVRPVSSSSYTGVAFSAILNDVDISVKNAAGNLLSVSASNINAAIRYLQIHNKASAPAGGDTPVFSFPIPAGTSTAPATVSLGREFLGQHGQHLTAGVAIGISTVAATFTAATTTDHTVNGTYV